MKYKFKVGDKVEYANDNGVYLGVKTIIGLSERTGDPTYFIEPTDTPWFSVREEFFKMRSRFSYLEIE